MLAAIFVVDVLDHLLAPLVLEIDIDVGRLAPLRRDEALEQQVGERRVYIGDADAIADGGIGGRAAALAQYALRAGEADDVLDGQEIGGIAKLLDQLQFMADLFEHALRHALRVAPGRALHAPAAPVPAGR